MRDDSKQTSRAELDAEIIAAARAYVTWADAHREANAERKETYPPEELARIKELDDAYDGIETRLCNAVYALEDFEPDGRWAYC